jgi:methionyl-tRNA formyltransferase
MALNPRLHPPLVFFGTGDFSLTALAGLIEASYEVIAVVTKPDSRTGRGHRLTPPPVKIFAERHSIPVWQPEKLSEIRESVQALSNPVGILASYGKIIPQSVIDLFSPGIINIHPSLLPLYRGPSPIEAAIANGDGKTGVSIMKLTARMDAGPVYAAKEYPLSGTETRPGLYRDLAQVGANLLLETLPLILDGSLPPLPQVEDNATYTPLLSKDDALLHPDAISAVQAERIIRAHIGFPKTKLVIKDHPVIITKAHVASVGTSPLDILCTDGGYLSIDEVIAPSGRMMSAADFARGYLMNQG